MAADFVKKLFKEDKTLQLSLEVIYLGFIRLIAFSKFNFKFVLKMTQKIAKMLKQKSYGVRPHILGLFLSLKLKEIQIVEEEKAKKLTHKEKMKLSRTDRKV